MKNVMIVALLSVGICVAGERAPNNAAPLQAPVLFVMAAAVAQENNGQVQEQKPKHGTQPKTKSNFTKFIPTRERNPATKGYKVKR